MRCIFPNFEEHRAAAALVGRTAHEGNRAREDGVGAETLTEEGRETGGMVWK